LISGALNSEALACTVILSLPLVALSTSPANWTTFSVWKLVGEYGVGMSHFTWAVAKEQKRAESAAAAAWAGFMGFLQGEGRT
jgi:hypothetical protein